MIDNIRRTDWNVIREEYIAGGVGQRELAERHGVAYSAVRRRAAEEQWVRLRTEALRGDGEANSAGNDAGGGNADIALRLRKKLLMRLERVADAIPDGAVTELKAQDDSATTRLFKLRDLTAAYKDLAGEIEAGESGDVEDLGVLAELLK